MKKSSILCLGLCATLMITGCKSKESAYRKAYDKAKAAETETVVNPVNTESDVPVVTPLVEKNVNQTQVTDNSDNVTVRQESVSVINGSGLRNFSVVVGSFSLPANAQGLQSQLKAAGYDAQIVKNMERNLYRVVASTHDNKADAVRSRDQFRSKYPDAWLLYNK
ncbi:MAG: SPOR domain-containing protein [Prevotella sp.]|jgi:cell division protein FtsN|nr:SPOR domain-containing protein [Prevotella sp.]MBQ1588830.1 SPOR domain-containing protein [Prevotella sp.]MBQ1627287.1 SPOR domain-containing protein [Prevotella sp.]MBQ1668640.1 SPOR domain-containing protein [Prevotella sp.]MBQ1702089.1 SPOR domain-containing protein [Prevotella sp.]